MRVSRDASGVFFVLAQTRLEAGDYWGSLRENRCRECQFCLNSNALDGCGRKIVICVREPGYDAWPGCSVGPARNHSHATRQTEKLERAVTALKQVEQRNEFAGRAAERKWVGRAKGYFGPHDALLAGWRERHPHAHDAAQGRLQKWRLRSTSVGGSV